MPTQKSAPLSVESLWEIERLSGAALSPDGSQAVCALTRYVRATNETSTQLWLLSTLGGAPRALTSCGDKDRQAAFSPQGNRIAFLARREGPGKPDATTQLYVMPVDGGEARRVSDIAMGVEGFKWMPDGKHVVCIVWVWPHLNSMAAQNKRHAKFSQRKESGYATDDGFYRYWDQNLPMGRVAHLVRVNIATGKAIDLFEDTAYELPRAEISAEMFDISADGKRIVFMHDPAPQKKLNTRYALTELNIARRRYKTLIDQRRWDVGYPRYSPDGQRVAAIATPVADKHTMLGQLAVIDADGKWKAFDADWDRDVVSPLRWSAAGDAVYFTAEQRGRCHLWQRTLSATRTAPTLVWQGGWVQSYDLRGADDTLTVAADSINHPIRIYAASLGGPKADGQIVATRLEQFNDALLSRVKLGRVEEVSVRGALGDEVQMWLVFPSNFKADKKHPLLQVIHGGPYTASGDTFGYRWNPHLLASQGHVVAMVNYHGSSGFGHAFRDSIMGRMGALELIDIEAGTDWMLSQPWADRSRVYASGGSYGGFMVAWMNGHVAPGRYRAYVCHAGVYDRAATWSADSYTQRFRDLHATYWDDPAKVAAQSPITFAANMRTPTLITHGALDYRVPDHNGLAYYNTLKARGISARLLWFPDENHWVLKAPNAKQWFGEVFAWLAAHQPSKRKS